MVSGFLSCFELKSALAELRSTTCCLEADLIICFGNEPYKCAFFSFYILHPCYLYDRMPDLAGRRLRQ